MKILTLVLTVASCMILAGLLIGLPLMWLWNALCPELFGLPRIDFWQAVGLYVLVGILFRTSSVRKSKE